MKAWLILFLLLACSPLLAADDLAALNQQKAEAEAEIKQGQADISTGQSDQKISDVRIGSELVTDNSDIRAAGRSLITSGQAKVAEGQRLLSEVNATIEAYNGALKEQVATADFRIWHDKSGKTMRAELEEILGNKVRVLRDDGVEFTLSTDTLSDEDNAWLERLGKTKTLTAEVRAGNTQGLSNIRKEDIDTTWRDDQGENALMYAASNGDLAVVIKLIDLGYPIGDHQDLPKNPYGENNPVGKTAKDFAVAAGHPDVGSYLGRIERTMSLTANIRAGQMQILDSTGAGELDVNWKDDQGKNALIYAAAAHDWEAAKKLIGLGYDSKGIPDLPKDVIIYVYRVEKTTALTAEIRDEKNQILNTIQGGDIDTTWRDDKGKDAIIYAAGNGDLASIKKLIALGYSINDCWDLMYSHGSDLPKNNIEAAKQSRNDADQGDPNAQYNLGVMYAKGDGVAKDSAEAVKWYLRAANQGYANAQRNVGLMYGLGEGVTENDIEAYKWLNLAAASGDSNAVKLRNGLAVEMTPTQIAEAQRDSSAFVAQSEIPETTTKPNTPDAIAKEMEGVQSSGTGFFITDDGYFLTCFHVVEDAKQVKLVTPHGTFAANVVKVDPVNDVALLKVVGSFHSLPVVPSEDMKLADSIFTIGFPDPEIQGLSPKYTKGEISSLKGIQDDPTDFQISVAVQPGNSGGPLVNQDGNVIGIIEAKLSASATYEVTGSIPENVNYATKSSKFMLIFRSITSPSKLKTANPPKKGTSGDPVEQVSEAIALVLVY